MRAASSALGESVAKLLKEVAPRTYQSKLGYYARAKFGREFANLNTTEQIVVSKAMQGLGISALICRLSYLGTDGGVKSRGPWEQPINNLMMLLRLVAKSMMVVAVGLSVYALMREEEWKFNLQSGY